jgi:hypothetical protein
VTPVTSPGGNVLVLLLEGGSRSELRRAVSRRSDDRQTVRIVAPASVGKLEWLTSDEDAAREDARERGVKAAGAISDQGPIAVERGDVDPVQAVEDALRTFTPDEILVVGGSFDGALEHSLGEFGIPVRRIGAMGPREPDDDLRRNVRDVAQGRTPASPFAFLAGVNLVVLSIVALIVLLALLIIWLV